MKENLIITISRENGTKGRSVGREVAKKLGVSFYDNESMANMFGDEKHKEYFMKSGETIKADSEFGLKSFEYYGTVNEKMYQGQSELMIELAKKGSAVFCGRCADVVLKDFPILRVFIMADLDTRVEAVAAATGKTLKQAKSEIKKMDKSRKEYYKYYGGQTWGARENYDLIINATHLSAEAIENIIIEAAKSFN